MLSPGVPLEQPFVAAARAPRRAGHRRDRAGVALAEGTRDRDHRHQGQVDDDDAHRTDARGLRRAGARRRQHRRAALRAGRRLDAGHGARRRGQQLPAGEHRPVSPLDCGAAELLAGPSRSPPDASRRTPPPRRACSGASSRRLGRGERRRPCRACDCLGGRRRAGAGSASSSVAEGVTVAGDTVVERQRHGRSAARAAVGRARAGAPHPERRARGLGDQPPGRRHGRRASRPPCARSPGSSTRWSWPATSAGVRFVNDSKATNIVSAKRSFESVPSGLVAILGGRYKGGDFGDLREALRGRARGVIAIGESHAAHRGRARRPAAGAPRRVDGRRGQPGVRPGGARATRWCLRRRVRASTCSRASRSAGVRSSRRWRGCGERAHEVVSSEQSSVGTRRLRAGCWERRLPRPAKLVSQPRSTDDC